MFKAFEDQPKADGGRLKIIRLTKYLYIHSVLSFCRLFSCLYSYKLTNVEKKPKWIQDPDQHYDQVFFREQNMSFANSLKMLREVAKRKRENDDEVPSAGQPGKYRKLTSPVLTSSSSEAANPLQRGEKISARWRVAVQAPDVTAPHPPSRSRPKQVTIAPHRKHWSYCNCRSVYT